MFLDPVTFKTDQVLHWQVGPLALWIRRTADEWHTAIQRNPGSTTGLLNAQPQSPPDDLPWLRSAALPDDFHCRLLPALPDKPVLVRPDSPFSFPPQSDLFFYVSVPLSIQIKIGPEGSVLLREEPALVLSNSWFGDPLEGLLCFALKTTARRSREALRAWPHLVACPIHIRNRSTQVLTFERLCVHTPHLQIYRDATRLWTNQVEVSYGGDTQPDSVTYAPSAPVMAPGAQLIMPAREPMRKGFLPRHFADLKSFTRM